MAILKLPSGGESEYTGYGINAADFYGKSRQCLREKPTALKSSGFNKQKAVKSFNSATRRDRSQIAFRISFVASELIDGSSRITCLKGTLSSAKSSWLCKVRKIQKAALFREKAYKFKQPKISGISWFGYAAGRYGPIPPKLPKPLPVLRSGSS